MDQSIFLTINGWVGHSVILDKIGAFFGGDYPLYLLVVLVAILWADKSLRTKIYLAVGSLFTARIVIVEIIKRVVNRPRPYEVLPVHQLIIDTEKGLSFPSGHATVYFAIAFAFWGTKYFWPFFILAVLGAFGRVFVGVHYPSDVIVGSLIGAGTSLLLLRLFKKAILS